MYGLCCKVFEDAPSWQLKLAKNTTVGSQYAFLISLLGIYSLSWGEGFGMLMYDIQFCKVWWVLLGALLLLPFHGTARQLGTWACLVWVNIASLMGTIFIPLVYFMAKGTSVTREPGSTFEFVSSSLGFEKVLSGVSTFTFAFTSQFMLIEIMSEMKDKRELPKAYVSMAAPFMGIAFLLVGLVGYYFLGSGVSVMLPQNLPFGDLYRIAAVCLLVHMLISYLIKGIVVCYGTHKVFAPQTADGTDRKAWIHWNIVVVSMFAFAFLLANLVPFFGDFVDLVGASVTPLSCYIMPLFMYMKWYKTHGNGMTSTFEWGIIYLELLLAFILMFAGTAIELKTIVAKWQTYGVPFACHCENLWNTCQCSAHHAGMEQCLIPALNATLFR